MDQALTLAGQILRLEQQLEAYRKLHSEELLELRRSLDECKRAITALCSAKEPTTPAANEEAGAAADLAT